MLINNNIKLHNNTIKKIAKKQEFGILLGKLLIYIQVEVIKLKLQMTKMNIFCLMKNIIIILYA